MMLAPNWDRVSKEFLVSLHHGVTEPEAIRALVGVPNAAVRLFLPKHRVDKSALLEAPVFHAKVLAVSRGATFSPDLLIASSMNLTSAIGRRTRNFEFGLLGLTEQNEDLGDFTHWWTEAWRFGRAPNERMIETYAKLRGDFLQENPILQTLPDPPENIGEANEFWIEVGQASGMDRHQVEFPEALAAFFAPVTRGRITLTLGRQGQWWPNRPLSYKVTTYGVEIWRQGMPTIRMHAEPIQGRVILFRRTAQPLTFEYDVADVASARARRWRNKSNLLGHLGRTRGERAREYGFNS
jgi:hypothetical protein